MTGREVFIVQTHLAGVCPTELNSGEMIEVAGIAGIILIGFTLKRVGFFHPEDKLRNYIKGSSWEVTFEFFSY